MPMSMKVGTMEKMRYCSRLLMEDVPLSITLNTSPVLRDMCHFKLRWWMCRNKPTWISRAVNCSTRIHRKVLKESL